jgi:hypothetical protein
VDGSTRSARLKFDFAERGLVAAHVLLQQRHERLGLLRAEIDALKIAQFYLGLRALLHGAKNEKEIPDIHPDLDAIGIGLAVVVGLNEFHIRLVRGIHILQCNAWAGGGQKRRH